VLKKLRRTKKLTTLPPSIEPGPSSGSDVLKKCEIVFRLVLRNRTHSDTAIHAFRKKCSPTKKSSFPFDRYRDEWILNTAFELLEYHFRPTGIEDLSSLIDPSSTFEKRLTQLDDFVQLLSLEEQWIIFTHDRFDLDLSLISVSLRKPLETIKLIRSQALETLERWIWQPT